MVTIKEIAERAGTSIGTVDRVIHRRGRVRRETEERVRRILEELDYRPNIFAKHLRLGRSHVFGVLMPKPAQDGMYWALPVRGIARARAELSSQRVDVRYFYYDKYSDPSFQKAGREVRAAQLDGLLVAPVVTRMHETFLRDLPSELPYVFFDSFLPNVPYLSMIVQDAFQSGVLAARLMEMLLGGRGSAAVLRVLPEDYHINDRVEGFLSRCRRKSGIVSRVYAVDGGKGRDRITGVLRSAFREDPDLGGIFVTNSTTHLAAAAIQSLKLARRPKLIGYDLVEDNVRLLRSGEIDFLISQQPERQGYEGIYALYRAVLLKERVPKKVMMPIDIVTLENLDYTGPGSQPSSRP